MDITKERMEEAVEYLAGTDVEYARARSYFQGLAEQRKTVKAMAFLRAPKGTVTAQDHEAYQSFGYKQHLEKMEAANLEYLTLESKRGTECIIIDCWRSLNAARNKGQFM